MWFKASAPGSLMLLGEYGVLQGKFSLVCAIDKRMSVTLKPRSDKQIKITSALGEFQTEIKKISIASPFQFVLAALKKFQKKLPSGCDIQIESAFSDKVGFASSAAVTVATVSALTRWLNLNFSDLALIRCARDIVRSVQGLGSGADVAACVLGGIVSYRAQPLTAEKFATHCPITVVYSGSKTPTVEAVTRVKNSFATQPELYKQLMQTIGHCAKQGVRCVAEQNWSELGKVMNVQQGLMDALGVNTTSLNDIVAELRQQPTILGAKISGSGLGDCVVALGSVPENFSSKHGQPLSVAITNQGVMCEKS